MRTSVEFRDRLLERARQIIARPGMYMTTGRDLDGALSMMLSDVKFLEESEVETARSALWDFYGQTGVVGPFEHCFGAGRYLDEVASVHAELFHRADFLSLSNTLSVEQYSHLVENVRDQYDELDFHRSDVERLWGKPSILAGTSVGCYAPPVGSSGWIYFDYDLEAEVSRTYQFGKGTHFEGPRYAKDPVLRNVRGAGRTLGGRAGADTLRQGQAVGHRLVDRPAQQTGRSWQCCDRRPPASDTGTGPLPRQPVRTRVDPPHGMAEQAMERFSLSPRLHPRRKWRNPGTRFWSCC